MNTDAVLRILIGVLGLMPTTFFLMQTLKWRGSITKVLILQISFNVLSCSAKEYMNLLSGQEVIGMTSWVLMGIYLSGDIFKRCISVLWRFPEKNHIDGGNRDRMYDGCGAYLQCDIRK